MANKLSEKELETLQELKQTAAEIASLLGELNYQKLALELMIDEQKHKIKDMKIKESAFFENIKSNYGAVTLNIDTGEFS